jgi:hypothetical protein
MTTRWATSSGLTSPNRIFSPRWDKRRAVSCCKEYVCIRKIKNRAGLAALHGFFEAKPLNAPEA